MTSSEPPPTPSRPRSPLHRLRAFLAAPLIQAVGAVGERLERSQADALAHLDRRLDGAERRADRLQDTADTGAVRLDGVERRLDAVVDGLERALSRLQQSLDGVAPRLDGVEARLDRLPPRLDGVEARLDGLPSRLDGVEVRLDRLRDRLDGVERLATRHGEVADDLARTLNGFTERQDEHAVAQTYVARQAAEHARRVAAAFDALGPRLDEIEVKTRPLIPYDAESWAVRLREGYVMIPRADPAFALAVADATTGGLEPGVRRVLRALIEPGMTVADVGANVGLLTLVCAYATGAEGRVLAFEPEARLRAQLAKTLHVNGLSWVSLAAQAVGAAPGRAGFNVSPVIGHSSLHALPDGEAPQVVEVEVTTLDAVIAPGQRLDVVKIDVEGAELEVLAGMARLLAENADIALVAEFGPSHLARLGQDRDGWFAAFAAQGFTPHLIGEPFGGCTPLDDLSVLDGVHSANIAFARPAGEARLRLPRA